MSDLFGLVVLLELSRKSARRKHEFEHLLDTTPVRTRLHRLARALGLRK
ncbi:hypothetical protein [Shinella sp. HZN7]|jgi:hypothetical protein|nr:hypothetical protein [Shinella sp. HZN7]